MCGCNDDFMDRAESVAKNLYGSPLSLDGMARNFALLGLKRRAATLSKFDSDLLDHVGSGEHNLRRHVQLMELRRKMGAIHDALRQAKR